MLLFVCSLPVQSRAVQHNLVTVQRVSLRTQPSGLQVDISADGALISQAQVLTNPDRIVIDFPNSIPSRNLPAISMGNGNVLRVRVAQFSANPPVTRVVLDLQSPQPYEVLPMGNDVWVKLGNHNVSVFTPSASAVTTPSSRIQVSFVRGMLGVHAEGATLAEVLTEIQRKTGASIDFPADAAQDQVIVELGPAPARDVLAALLDGSRFNFVMMGSDRDPNGLHNVLLTLRTGGVSQPAGQPTPYVPPPNQGVTAEEQQVQQPTLPEGVPEPVELPEQESGSPGTPGPPQQ